MKPICKSTCMESCESVNPCYLSFEKGLENNSSCSPLFWVLSAERLQKLLLLLHVSHEPKKIRRGRIQKSLFTPLSLLRCADSISKAAVNMYCMKLARELNPVSTSTQNQKILAHWHRSIPLKGGIHRHSYSSWICQVSCRFDLSFKVKILNHFPVPTWTEVELKLREISIKKRVSRECKAFRFPDSCLMRRWTDGSLVSLTGSKSSPRQPKLKMVLSTTMQEKIYLGNLDRFNMPKQQSYLDDLLSQLLMVGRSISG